MSALAIDPADPAALTLVMQSSRQPPAASYGSAFARAAVWEWGGWKTVFISGTASIDAAGATVHADDPEAQCVETLLNVAALLEEQGGSLEDVVMATLFCKDRAALDAYRGVTRLLGIRLPTLAVRADVCRSDLLVEIEAVAVVRRARGR
jgi:enamine deaminase RidA (YjgF/YER057c/UK114 family)